MRRPDWKFIILWFVDILSWLMLCASLIAYLGTG